MTKNDDTVNETFKDTHTATRLEGVVGLTGDNDDGTPHTATQLEGVEIVGAQEADGSATVAAYGTTTGHSFKIKKILTLPLLKLMVDVPVYIKFTGATFVGKKIDEGDKSKEPPIMANVVNLATGELVQIMLGSVLQGILRDEYPGNTYIDRGFQIVLTEKKRAAKGAGTYNTYRVAELEL